jgi:molybdate transport system permease protein
VRTALAISLETSTAATALCCLLGLPTAYLLARHRYRGQLWIDTLLDLPMTIPPVVAGLALLLAFGRMGLLGRHLEALGLRIGFTRTAVLLAQTFMAAPFFVRAARAGFASVPVHLEDAAMTLGRRPWNIFWTVSVPLAAPALLAGAVLAWARALSEFGATLLFAGNVEGVTQTLPLAVMSQFNGGSVEGAVAVATVSLLLAVFALGGSRLLLRGVARF